MEDSYVRRALGSPRCDIWQAIFDTVTDPQVSEDLTWIRRQMPRGNAITPHRILDVIAWRKQQGHHCPTHAQPPAQADTALTASHG